MVHPKFEATYRYAATSVPGLVQQLVLYLANGYWFYVSGTVPESKDPERVAAKLMARYGICASKYVRARRKRRGFYNVHFIMHERRWWLLATNGVHHAEPERKPDLLDFFRTERPKDVRRTPLKAFGYSLTAGKGVQVRIEREQYALIRDWLLEHAIRRKSLWLEFQIYRLPFEPYGPVRAQLGKLVNRINERRRKCGFERVRKKCIRFKIRRVKPFEKCRDDRAGDGSGE